MWCFPQRIVPNQGSIPPIERRIKRKCLMR
uniref:Uncharacterized protein n=1 Tax=Caudovirales sp. cts2v4 TaxID=2825773 RepID=A0A8S5PNL0_9CAUD|nr:MAG TPA: hypothetical protein [Caudovirales sp. cts2v4]DAT57008.1 MAG TPA: hypothetical protein [Caudoviricetes sp.]